MLDGQRKVFRDLNLHKDNAFERAPNFRIHHTIAVIFCKTLIRSGLISFTLGNSNSFYSTFKAMTISLLIAELSAGEG